MLKKSALFLCLVVMPWLVHAETFTPGKDYRVLQQPIKTSGDTIVVNEFFGYSCPHCNSFHPLLKRWEKTLPADVSFVPVPVVFSRAWEMNAKAYYIAVQLGVYETVHDAMFNAIHVDKRSLGTKPALRKFFVEQGVSAAGFDKAYDSFGLKNNIRKGNRLAAKARVTGVPTLMVAGKYVIESGMAGSHARMLDITDFLIAKEQAAN